MIIETEAYFSFGPLLAYKFMPPVRPPERTNIPSPQNGLSLASSDPTSL